MSEVKLKFTADTGEAISGINKIKNSLNGMKSAVNTGFGNAFSMAAKGAAVAIAGISTALLAGTKDIIDYAGSLKDVSDALGISIKNASIFQRAFEAAGIPAEALEKILAKVNLAMSGGDKTVVDTVRELGLSYQDLKSAAPDEQLKRLGDAINAITDKNKQLELTANIVGSKLAPSMVRLFGDKDAFNAADKYLGQLSGTMEEIAPSLEGLGDALDGIKYKSRQFMGGMTTQFGADNIEKLTDTINNLDLTDWGKKFGAGLIEALKAIDSGEIYAAIAPAILKAFEAITKEVVMMLAYGFYKVANDLYIKFSKTKLGAQLIRPEMQEYLNEEVKGKTWFGWETTVGTRKVKNPNYVKDYADLTESNYSDFRDSMKDSFFVNQTHNAILGLGVFGAAKKLGVGWNALKSGIISKEAIQTTAVGAAMTSILVGKNGGNGTPKKSLLDRILHPTVQPFGAKPNEYSTEGLDPWGPWDKAQQGKKDERFINEFFANMTPWKGQMGIGFKPSIFPAWDDAMKSQSGFIPNLTSFGKKGGAAGEIGQSAVVNFQKQSLKHLSNLEMYSARIWKFLDQGISNTSKTASFQ